ERWLRFLPWAEYAYDTSFHEGAGMTPFQIVYGREPPILQSYLEGSSSVAAMDEELNFRDQALKTLHVNLQHAQAKMKSLVDKHRSDVVYNVGDQVYVRLQPYRQISLAIHKSHKLPKRYYGPFAVLKRIGQCAYELDLPSFSKIHRVFHVSLL